MAVTATEYLSTPPGPGARRYGLLTVAEAVDEVVPLPPRALGGGVAYDPDFCATAAPFPVLCPADTPPNKTVDEGSPSSEWSPFAVYNLLQCGLVGYDRAEWEAKARRRLEAGEQGAVELAVWTGLTAVGGTSLGIDGFNNSSPTSAVAADNSRIDHVVGVLEEFAYHTQGYGYEAYIHAPPIVASFAAAEHLIVQDGPVKRTPYGSIWVFGGGYPGTDSGGTEPSGGTAIYITGKTTVWRESEVFVPPPNETFDQATNQQFALAERVYTVGFDCLLGEGTFIFPSGA